MGTKCREKKDSIIVIQSSQLQEWKNVLKKEVFNLLEKWATKDNDSIKDWMQILRGDTLNLYIRNFNNTSLKFLNMNLDREWEKFIKFDSIDVLEINKIENSDFVIDINDHSYLYSKLSHAEYDLLLLKYKLKHFKDCNSSQKFSIY
jgi:hypothetical protein